MDIDASGDHLIVGSTTGSVGASEDQSDSRQTISTHLPPVTSVRFG